MHSKNEPEILRLRPHHILCLPFIDLDSDHLDQEFYQTLTRIKQLLTSRPDLTVTFIEGVDEICRACPSCVGDRCDSLPVQEDMVRKIDEFLLKQIGKSYGEILVGEEWQSLISDNWPYRLCRACRWRGNCGAQVI